MGHLVRVRVRVRGRVRVRVRVRGVKVVLVAHLRAEDDLHHAALVVDGEAMDPAAHRVHAPLYRHDRLVDLSTGSGGGLGRGWG